MVPLYIRGARSSNTLDWILFEKTTEGSMWDMLFNARLGPQLVPCCNAAVVAPKFRTHAQAKSQIHTTDTNARHIFANWTLVPHMGQL